MASYNTAIDSAIKYLGEDLFSSLNLSFEKSEDENCLEIIRENNNILIKYGILSSLFRGLTYIKEHISENTYSVSLKRNFKYNGLMHDCSRNGVMKVSEVKNYIMILALMGHNRLMLYTEDTYEVKERPYFGYLRGRYSEDEIKEIVDYAEQFGVDVIPCIQTLSHLGRTLRWNAHNFRDTYSTLAVWDDEAKVFIEDLIKSCKRMFKSKYIHIGMDEATDLGSGKFIRKNEVIDRQKEFLNNLIYVCGLCDKYELTPMMWSDMFFKLAGGTEDYYLNKKLNEEILSSLPQNIQLVFWDYYHDNKDHYDESFDAHKKTHRHILFAGGSIRWIGFTPSSKASLKISKAALESCVEKGVDDIFVTAWGDDGAECSIYTTLPVLAEFSAYDFEGKYDELSIDSLLRAVTGESLSDLLALDLPNILNPVHAPYANPSKFFFYQDPMLGQIDRHVLPHYANKYHEHYITLKNIADKNTKYSFIYNNLADLSDFLSVKVELGVKLRNAYQNGDLSLLEEMRNITIPSAIVKLDKFHESFYTQWMKENKPFGYEVIDGRIGFLKARLEYTLKQVAAYLNKEIDEIPELKEKILQYEGVGLKDEFCSNTWLFIANVDMFS